MRDLDRMAQTEAFADELLNTTAAYDMRVRIGQVVALLEELDTARLLASRGLLSRLTGADVEARLKFELAGERVVSAIEELRFAAGNASHIRGALAAAHARLLVEQDRLDAIVATARDRLARTQDADAFHLARFERRLSNIMAIHAANLLTLRQMELAKAVLSDLLDRFTDVDTLLLPLWQRNMLALASSTDATRKGAARAFSSAHASLIQHLKQDAAAQ